MTIEERLEKLEQENELLKAYINELIPLANIKLVGKVLPRLDTDEEPVFTENITRPGIEQPAGRYY